MITLHQYPAAFGLPSLSPFCLKVEYFLKLARLPYEVKVELNPARGPKGKMPFIKDGERIIADSSFILDDLMERYQLSHLRMNDPRAVALKAMIEEGLYFVLLYSRWVDDDGYRTVKEEFTPLVGAPFLYLIRKSLIKQAKAQGIGRHSPPEAYRIGCRYIDALAASLGGDRFMFSEKVTELDVVCFSFLQTIVEQRIESPLKVRVKEHQNLVEYVERLGRALLVIDQATANITHDHSILLDGLQEFRP